MAGLTRRPEDAAIVKAALAFGSALGLSVVAEGIETQAQLSRLRALGCGYGQGLLISAPLPAEDIERILRSGRSLVAGAGRRARVRPAVIEGPAAPALVPEAPGTASLPAYRATP